MKVANSNIAYAYREFGALIPTELHYLELWQRAACAVGIHAVEDLIQRRWPCSVDGAVIEVFMEGEEAEWLVVKHNGRWAVACCAYSTVSDSVETLANGSAEFYAPDNCSPCEPS
jgi:hypothetical protein